MIKTIRFTIDKDLMEVLPILETAQARLAIARNVMEGARAKLIKIAGRKLKSSRMDYIQGIQPLEVGLDGVSLIISGALPVMVEEGWDGRLLHETLLRLDAPGAKKIRVSKEGHRYRHIPFRQKTPRASMQGGQPMGSQFQPRGGLSREAPKTIISNSADLGKMIAKKARSLKAGEQLPAGLAPKLRPHHTTDVFAGMKVNLQPVEGKGGKVRYQRTYTTFRTISENVTDKWYHPGIEARNFLDDVHRYVVKVAPGAVNAYVSEALQ